MPASDFQSLPPFQLPERAPSPQPPSPPSGSQQGEEDFVDVGPQDAWNFVSPNVEEGLTYEKAYSLLQSSTQSKFRQMTEDMMQASGVKPEIYDAIGDWVDDDGKAGAENSVASVFKGQIDPKVVEYLASWQGLLRNQKGILTFQGQPGGKDSLYQVYIPDSDTNGIRDQLTRLGIQNRTIIPREGGGNLVVLFDMDRADKGKVAKFAEVYNARVREAEGTGQFFGGSSRTAARSDYRKRIRAFESGPSGDQSGSIRQSAGASGSDTSESPSRPRSEFQFAGRGPKMKFSGKEPSIQQWWMDYLQGVKGNYSDDQWLSIEKAGSRLLEDNPTLFQVKDGPQALMRAALQEAGLMGGASPARPVVKKKTQVQPRPKRDTQVQVDKPTSEVKTLKKAGSKKRFSSVKKKRVGPEEEVRGPTKADP